VLDPVQTRKRIRDCLDEARQEVITSLKGTVPSTFRWMSRAFWLDRTRLLVLPNESANARGFGGLDAIPASQEEDIEISGPRHSTTGAWDVVKVMASMISPGPDRPILVTAACDLIELAVIQPMVNPAFESIFWLALYREINPRGGKGRELGAAMGPLAFDMSGYPASRAEAGTIRAAQVAFIDAHLENISGDRLEDRERWLVASDEAWADRCADVVAMQTTHLDLLFREIEMRARA